MLAATPRAKRGRASSGGGRPPEPPRSGEAPLPCDEAERLAALRRYGPVDAGRAPAFDRLARLAAAVAHTPIAWLSLVEGERQWFRACHGIDLTEVPRRLSIFAHTILGDDLLVLPDARLDRRFADNPLVAGETGLRFYAGAPLRTADGFNLGALCVADTRPHAGLRPGGASALADLASLAVDELELRRPRPPTVGENPLVAHVAAALAGCPLAVATLTPDGRLTSWNPAAEAMFGWRSDEVLGRRLPIVPQDRRGEHDAIMRAIRAGDRISGLELRRQRKDGTEIEVRLATAPILGGDGAAVGFVDVFEDITRLKRWERGLLRAKQRAEANSRAKSEFIASMSHELRTPLTAIIGFADILERELYGPLGGSKYLDYARDIHDSGRHLLRLINMLLDLSRIEAGVVALEETEVDVGAVVEGCLRLMAPQAEAAVVRLQDGLPDGLPRLKADATRLRQMLLNLLSNAVKFTPAGGTVTAGASLNPRGRLDLWVRDTGVGIAPSQIAAVLAPYGQVQNPLVRAHDGVGLGLPVTQRLVEQHGGELVLDSEPGRGTTVTLRFPAARVPRAVASPAS